MGILIPLSIELLDRSWCFWARRGFVPWSYLHCNKLSSLGSGGFWFMRDDTGQSVVVGSRHNSTTNGQSLDDPNREVIARTQRTLEIFSKQKPTTCKRLTGTQDIPQQQRDFSNPSLHLVLRACSPTCLLACLSSGSWKARVRVEVGVGVVLLMPTDKAI